jgi:hypothetical protein
MGLKATCTANQHYLNHPQPCRVATAHSHTTMSEEPRRGKFKAFKRLFSSNRSRSSPPGASLNNASSSSVPDVQAITSSHDSQSRPRNAMTVPGSESAASLRTLPPTSTPAAQAVANRPSSTIGRAASPPSVRAGLASAFGLASKSVGITRPMTAVNPVGATLATSSVSATSVPQVVVSAPHVPESASNTSELEGPVSILASASPPTTRSPAFPDVSSSSPAVARGPHAVPASAPAVSPAESAVAPVPQAGSEVTASQPASTAAPSSSGLSSSSQQVAPASQTQGLASSAKEPSKSAKHIAAFRTVLNVAEKALDGLPIWGPKAAVAATAECLKTFQVRQNIPCP